jgi:hypothetical protein
MPDRRPRVAFIAFCVLIVAVSPEAAAWLAAVFLTALVLVAVVTLFLRMLAGPIPKDPPEKYKPPIR